MILASISSPFQLRLRQPLQWTTARIVGLLGIAVIGAVVLVTYYSALKIGFWTDDYGFLESAGRLSWPDYLALYFDPRVQISWYRPMQGLQWRFEYLFFRGDPTGYHLVQILFHLANCVLLYDIVRLLTHKPRIGLVAGLVYAALPIYSVTIMWLAVTDALAGMFCLLTIWLWLGYLERGGMTRYALTFIVFIAALFSKEVIAPLPFVLLLIDRWLIAKPSPSKSVIGHNAPFFLFLPVYALLESNAILNGVFPKNMGYSPGLHSFSVLFQFLLQMIYPSETESLVNYAGLAILLVVLLRALYKRDLRVLFLAVTTLLVLLPLMPFHSMNARYLYMPLMLSGVGFALACDWFFVRFQPVQWVGRLLPTTISLAVVILVMGASSVTAERGDNFAGTVRQTNSYFRPLFQRYPSVAPGTLLYFVDPPFVTYNVSGMMFLRYGANVSVAGVETKSHAELLNHGAALVLYSDDQGEMQIQSADKTAALDTALTLPVRFQGSIFLDGYEPVSTQMGPGGNILLLIYWHAAGPVDKNYTVFSHLVASDGKIVSGYDSQPQRGRRPMQGWGAGEPIADTIVLPIGPDLPPGGKYRLELGLYDSESMQRLPAVDGAGHPIGDSVILEPYTVLP